MRVINNTIFCSNISAVDKALVRTLDVCKYARHLRLNLFKLVSEKKRTNTAYDYNIFVIINQTLQEVQNN